MKVHDAESELVRRGMSKNIIKHTILKKQADSAKSAEPSLFH